MKNQASFLASAISQIPNALKAYDFSPEIVERATSACSPESENYSYLYTFGSIVSYLRGALDIAEPSAQDVVLYACQLAELKRNAGTEEYRAELLSELVKLIGTELAGGKLCYDNMSGCFSVRFGEIEIFCTPFWEGSLDIGFQQFDEEGAEVFDGFDAVYELSGDLEQDKKNYIEVVALVLKDMKNINSTFENLEQEGK